ncbi:MAG: MATE family efflux transporter, partial [Bacteroidia bacterium]|nr:MATE family efflux transporter [Bacteroidia bacterium]
MKLLGNSSSELRSILSLSYPLIISQLGSVLMGVADNMMVGPLGTVALAASSLANTIFFLCSIIGIGT